VKDSERNALVVSLQTGLPYAGLRSLEVDPSLMLYVPAALARREEVVPLSLKDNVLSLACAHPDTDVSPITERFPRLQIELCISPPEEIGAVLDGLTERS
jgi:hypothetical protein